MAGKRRRGIYLLPNLITTASLLLGFYAAIRALDGDFITAAAAVLDGIDGRVARMLGIDSRFGAEFDSLTDAIVFGVVPALVMYLWLLPSVEESALWRRLIWLTAFFYTASTVLRLARFNVQAVADGKHVFFRGMPSPAAAALVMSMIWAWQDWGYSGQAAIWTALITLVLTSAAMVSNFSYYSLKGINFRDRVPFIAIFLVVAVFAVASIDVPRFLLFISLAYSLSGPGIYLLRVFRRKQRGGKQRHPVQRH